jgi:7-cyano-7-deazaguanine synthase in queuosine biosynthesis
MKTYQEVIERAARRIYSSYADGGNEYYNVVDYDEIAFIFEKTDLVVYEDCKKVFLEKVEEAYNRFALQKK